MVPPTAPAPDRQRAFRFILTDGKLALEAVDDIQGARPATPDDEPAGELLATIPLAP